jgi:cardiolipin synthase
VRLLQDARENYPAWLEAISAAQRHVHFESYFLREDEAGQIFANALLAKAREGVRVRWNGTMLHAKTAVADGHWARVGSTNLNLASWFGNCELDVVVE